MPNMSKHSRSENEAPGHRSAQGRASISGRGRPGLRLAAWRAVFAALRTNPVLAARYAHLTARPENPLAGPQATVAVAAALLRQLHAVVTTRTAWDARIAAGRGGTGAPAAQEAAA